MFKVPAISWTYNFTRWFILHTQWNGKPQKARVYFLLNNCSYKDKFLNVTKVPSQVMKYERQL